MGVLGDPNPPSILGECGAGEGAGSREMGSLIKGEEGVELGERKGKREAVAVRATWEAVERAEATGGEARRAIQEGERRDRAA